MARLPTYDRLLAGAMCLALAGFTLPFVFQALALLIRPVALLGAIAAFMLGLYQLFNEISPKE